eukprot:53442-Eustigmatos_ZCMA.PRE.1
MRALIGRLDGVTDEKACSSPASTLAGAAESKGDCSSSHKCSNSGSGRFARELPIDLLEHEANVLEDAMVKFPEGNMGGVPALFLQCS